MHNWRASVSHVTGAHSRKFGLISTLFIDDRNTFGNSLNLTYRVNNGVPNGVTETALPMELHQRTAYTALFAQEQWTIHRLTLQGALRFDRSWSYFAPQTLPASNYLPFTVSYPKTEGVRGYKDLTPRLGLAYDLFGNAKTALKVNLGKYLEASSNGVGFYSTTNPINRLTTTSGLRTWSDVNGNFIPDCDLLNMSPNQECGQGSALFGKEVFTSNVDPAAMGGWRVRPSDWGLTASVQQEVLPRVSVEVGYTRRWLQHFVVTDNLVVTAADFGQFSVTAPSDSRLPGGGGYSVAGLYDVNLAFGGQSNTLATFNDLLPAAAAAIPALQRRHARRQRQAAQRAAVPGRDQHREDGDRQLRGAGAAAGNQSAEPVLPQRAGLHHPLDGSDVLHDSAGRRHRQRHDQKRSGGAAPGHLVGAALGHRAVARTGAVGQPAVRGGQPDHAG